MIDNYNNYNCKCSVEDGKCGTGLTTYTSLLGTNTQTNQCDRPKSYDTNTNSNLKVYYSDFFHDRYFIIDDNKIYQSGNSINHIGYRKSSINVLSDKNVKANILNDVYSIIC